MANFNTTITDRDWWFFRSPTYFNQIFVNGLTGGDGRIVLNGQDLYSMLSGLSGSYDDIYTYIQTTSAIWFSTYTTVNTYSSIWMPVIPDLNAVTTIGASTTNTLYLSNAYMNDLITGSVATSGITINNHIGATNTLRVVLMDENGNSFLVNLRGGVLTFD